MYSKYHEHVIRKVFAGMVEQAFFAEVGVCDPRVTDYLVMMMLEFIHVDGLYRLRDRAGRRLKSLSEMRDWKDEDLWREMGVSPREFHRYLGDFALFWAGLFPEGLEGRRRSAHPDRLAEYVGTGKESYAIASRLFDEESDPPGSVLRRLSNDFEVCAHGLGLVRQHWDRRDGLNLDEPPTLVY